MSTRLGPIGALALVIACSRPETVELEIGPPRPLPAPAVAEPAPAADDLQPVPLAAPGHIAGGLVYATIRPSQLQTFLQAVPLDARLTRLVAGLSARFGGDLRQLDLVAQLGLDPAGTITATLARPLAPHLPDIRRGVERLAVADPEGGAVDFVATPYGGPPPPPLPDDLLRQTGAIVSHSRFHVPVRDPSPLLARVKALKSAPGLCERLPAHDACWAFAESGALLVRHEGEALIADVVFHPFDQFGAPADDERALAMTAALTTTPATLGVLSRLAGDVALYVHGPALVPLVELRAYAHLVDRLRATHVAARRSTVDRALGVPDAYVRLRDTRRLFTGVRLDVAVDLSDVRATMSWEPADQQAAQQVEALLVRQRADLPAPTMASLCEGAVACMQMGRLPRFAGFDALAIGQYAAFKTVTANALAAEEVALAAFALETWPNVLGALHRLHDNRGVEVVAGQTILERAERLEGVGWSLRAGDTGAGTLYARMQGDELNLVRSLAGVSGAPFVDSPVAGLAHRVSRLKYEQDQLFLVVDEDPRSGWFVATNDEARLRWLLAEIPHEPTDGPPFQLEIDDLPAVAALAGLPDLTFMRELLADRRLQITAAVADGRPRLDLALTRRPAAAPAESSQK